jgi:hypothetical protein
MSEPSDKRIAYGVRCTWWDSVHQTGTVGGCLPCCPICKGVLFEVPTETEWFAGVDEHDKDHPGYRKMMEWSRGKCFPNYATVKEAYEKETGERGTL